MANLRIYGEIVDNDMKVMCCNFNLVSFKSVDDFIKSIDADDERIDVELDCKGGSVSEGWKIYDAMRASGKKISVNIVGDCASMATIVLLSAPLEARTGRKNARLLIHDPYYSNFSECMRSNGLRKAAEELDAEKSKMLDVYVERTGTDRDTLDALMAQEKWITMQEAKDLNFINFIQTPISAKMNKKKTLLAKIAALLSGEMMALELTTLTGSTLKIDREEGDPQVGDAASPDGEHKMPDGSTIIVVDGVIIEIKKTTEPTPEPTPTPEPEPEAGAEDDLAGAILEIQRLKDENEALKLELEKLKGAEKLAKTPEEMKILNLVKIAGGVKWLEGAKSNYKVDRGEPRDFKGGRQTIDKNAVTGESIINFLKNQEGK